MAKLAGLVVAICLMVVAPSYAWAPSRLHTQRRGRVSIAMAAPDDGSSNPLLGAINAFGNALTKSPLNEGKKAMVKVRAWPLT